MTTVQEIQRAGNKFAGFARHGGPHKGIKPGQIYELARVGFTQIEIAKKLGVSDAAISQMRKRHGIKCLDGRLLNARRRYATCAAAGLTRAETAERLGVKRKTVDWAVGRYGLRFKKAVRA